MSQLLLFDRLSRPTDPPTSHEAAAKITPRLAGLRAEFVARLLKIQPATANEVADGNESIRKRAKELERDGLIHAVGFRLCRVTRCKAMEYEVSQ